MSSRRPRKLEGFAGRQVTLLVDQLEAMPDEEDTSYFDWCKSVAGSLRGMPISVQLVRKHLSPALAERLNAAIAGNLAAERLDREARAAAPIDPAI